MSKITEYTQVSTIRNDDVLLVDGTRGTKIITASNAAKQLMDKVIAGYDIVGKDEVNRERIATIRSSILNSSVSQEVSGPMVAFSDGANNVPVKSARLDIRPIISGTGTPSASNIRRIIGWNTLEIVRCSKNIVNMIEDGTVPSTTTGQLINGDGHRTGFIRLNSSFKYICVATFDSSVLSAYHFIYYDQNKNVVSSMSYRTAINRTLTPPSKAEYLMISVDTDQPLSANYSIAVIPTPAFTYSEEEYTGTTYSVAIPTDLDAIFFGTVDLVAGIIESDYGQIQSYAGESLPGMWYSDRDVYAEGTTPSTGAQVVYELEQPQIYNVDPANLTTLYGNNVAWSEAGDLTIEYIADLPLYVNSVIDETL